MSINSTDEKDGGLMAVAPTAELLEKVDGAERLSVSGMPRHKLDRLIQRIAANDPISEVCLVQTRIDSDTATALAAALQHNTTLCSLFLQQNGLGPDSTMKITKALADRYQVTLKLGIESNGIGDQGAAAVAQLIHSNPCFLELYLSDNGIGPDGARALATHAGAIHRGLYVLALGGNPIGDEGVAAITQAMCTGVSIHALDISDTGLTDAGVMAVAKAVSEGVNIHSLRLGCVKMTDETEHALREAVKEYGRRLQQCREVSGDVAKQ